MPDSYQLPALVLTALLLPAFGFLYVRFKNTRTLLWFLGFLCVVTQMAILYRLGARDVLSGSHGWWLAAAETAIQIGSALFLGSLSPLGFRLGRINVLYVVPYTLPLVALSILFYGAIPGVKPGGSLFLIF